MTIDRRSLALRLVSRCVRCRPCCALLPPQSECVARSEERPAYRKIEATLRGLPWAMSSKPLAERLQYEARFIQDSLNTPQVSQQQQQRPTRE